MNTGNHQPYWMWNDIFNRKKLGKFSIYRSLTDEGFFGKDDWKEGIFQFDRFCSFFASICFHIHSWMGFIFLLEKRTTKTEWIGIEWYIMWYSNYLFNDITVSGSILYTDLPPPKKRWNRNWKAGTARKLKRKPPIFSCQL